MRCVPHERAREKPPAEVPVVEACVPEPPVPLEDEEREEEEEVPTRTESPPPPAAAAIEEATNEPKRRGSGGNMVQVRPTSCRPLSAYLMCHRSTSTRMARIWTIVSWQTQRRG